MSHYRRAHIPGGCYFFTVVTLNRAPVFGDEAAVEALRTAIRQVRATRPFEIDGMVVLPDHLHCLWQLPPGDADYSSRWREIKKATSRLISPQSNDQGERQVWQRRFWEHAIRDETDWQRHLDYIHYNPVKHGLVSRPRDWSWSSFHTAVARQWYDADWGNALPAHLEGIEWE